MKVSQEKLSFISLVIMVALLSCPALAADYYVAVNGNDTNPGSFGAPFATIQKAADTMSPGDTCYIRGGTYRETVNLHRSGTSGHIIKFTCYKAEKVVIDGTDVFNADWIVHSGNIFKADTDKQFEQLFVDGTMMVEARWPNIQTPDGVFSKNTWAYVDNSSLGRVTDSAISTSGINWVGGYGAFNVSQQMDTWIRKVETQNGNTITYDINGVNNGLNASFNDDRYYLFGKLEALDIAGEWFLDTDSQTAYLWTKEGDSPANHTLVIKQRDYGFDAVPDTDYIELNGLHFFGCEFRFQQNCHYITVDDCHLLYSNYSRTIPTMAYGSSMYNGIPTMAGHHLTFQNCTIAHCLMNGQDFLGSYVTAKNNLLYDTNWNGSNQFSAMIFASNADVNSIYGQGNSLARDNTIYYTGNVAIKFRHPYSTAEYNNLSNGGLAGKDTTLLYTAMEYPDRIFQYNWLHDSHGWDGQGLGLRLDGNPNKVQCLHAIVRGNVVWNLGGRGFVIKGLNHRVYNNTVLNEFNLMFDSHQQTEVYNNYARSFTFTSGATQGSLKFFSNNSTTSTPRLANTVNLDFTPLPTSSLINAGTSSRSDYQWRWFGNAPDIGAYEFGLIPWRTPGYRPIRASQPVPQDYAKNVDPCNLSISWTGTETGTKNKFKYTFMQNSNIKLDMAVSKPLNFYDVYFGTSLTAVGSADHSSPEFKGYQRKTSYSPKTLDANTTYYWRIDTFDAKKNFIKYGHIWSFTTSPPSL